MKKIFFIILSLIAFNTYSQREYTYENKGVNLFLEGEGGGNLNYGIGGVALTVGYQFNPHFFFGGGVSTKFGAERDIYTDYHYSKGWYDSKTNTFHTDYWIDQYGIYHDNNYSHFYDYDECDCCDGDFGDLFMDLYAEVRYNFLAQKRYTPYLSLRSGVYFGSENCNAFDEALLGCRFGCGEGDFAIVGGAGYSFRRFEKSDLSNQHMFILRLGMEF